MTTPEDANTVAGGSPVERRVGRLEPERDDLPSTVFVVLDEMGIPVFCAAYPQACHDHISDAIVEHEIHSAGLWVVREYTLDPRTRSQKLADAGFTRRPSLRAMDMREALELIAAPMRPDGTWNRDREACRELAAEALGRYDDDPMPHGHHDITDNEPGPRPLLDAMTVRNACPRGYNGCGFDAKAQECVAAECPKTPNVGGEARLAAHQPLHTTTATPQGVASTDQLGRASEARK